MISFKDMITPASPPPTPSAGVEKRKLTIAKMDDERRLAFGWASVAIRVDGEQIEDWRSSTTTLTTLRPRFSPSALCRTPLASTMSS